MMTPNARQLQRQEALMSLLTECPIPSDLSRIGYSYRLPRHPPGPCGPGCTRTMGSDPEIMRRDLGTAYVERRRHESGQDISCVVSVRKHVVQRLRAV